MLDIQKFPTTSPCRAVVIWIDWYAYHLARFEGLQQAFGYNGEVIGLELVGGIGVHTGLKFREERNAGLPVQTVFPNSSWHETSKLKIAYALWRRLNKLQPELVLVPGYYTLPGIAAALWARLHGRASVLMTESTAYDHVRVQWKEKLKSNVLRSLFNWAVVGGAAHLRYLKELGFRPDRVVRFYDVVGNVAVSEGVSTLRRGSRGEDYNLPDCYFLFVGRLAREKNCAGLLRAWLQYRKEGGKWSLVLAGDGPEGSMLRHLLDGSSFIEDVIFTGHKSSNELLPLFSFASCFVLPSTREPWGLVVNEAMAAGLPVIVSTSCGCAEDLVESGQNGLLFDPSIKGELAASMHWISELSEQERARMAFRSKQIIEAYSPGNFGREIAKIAEARTRWDAQADSRRESAA